MALIKCAECGKEISSKASACPNCGCPIEKETKKVILTRAVGIASLVKGNIIIDNQIIGNLKNGETREIDLPIGKHTISIETYVHNGLYGGNVSRNVEAQQFTIEENHKKVYILIS